MTSHFLGVKLLWFFREGRMRVLLAAVAICLAASALPASAQGGGGCPEWCRVNRCTGGLAASMGATCINKCVAACEAKKKGKKS